jgi:L-aspartate oxidase
MDSAGKKRVAVVGSGIAGLVAALEAAKQHEVVLISKADLGESNTHYAQGGIAAVTSDDDSVASHISDTEAAGAGLCWSDAVTALCSEGPTRINELIELGVHFDEENGHLARGLEAAHSHARVLHAGGDATGADISRALVAAARSRLHSIHENAFLTKISTDAGRVTGITYRDASGQQHADVDVVILASGGAGQLYRHTTNPGVTTGDGVAAALWAGAWLADVEFYQFHPTALAVPGSFLISEAVRGEGAHLINERGERFMSALDPRGELAPRDVVARGIQAEMIAQGGQPILLDATGLGADFLAERFPSITAACRHYGLDWSREPIPVTPAAHYWMGGVATDVWGRSNIEGLYAVGEVACTGAHGANRLASNSLLESLVFSFRAVSTIGQPWPADAPAERWRDSGPLDVIELDKRDILAKPDSGRQVVDRVELQTLMWDDVGLARTGERLDATRARLQSWRATQKKHRFFPDWEDASLLALAHAVTAAAAARHESRGAHYRLDDPATKSEMARPIIVKRRIS